MRKEGEQKLADGLLWCSVPAWASLATGNCRHLRAYNATVIRGECVFFVFFCPVAAQNEAEGRGRESNRCALV